MKRVRIGNDFIFLWKLNRGNAPERLSQANNFVLTLYKRIFGRNGIQVPYNIINGNTIKVEITPEIANITGNYYFKVSYFLDDLTLTDKERDVKIDVAAFQITPRSFQSENIFEVIIESNLLSLDTSVEVIEPPQANATERAIRKIRKDNGFVFDWKIIRNDEPENFAEATNIKLYQYCKRFGENKKEVAYSAYNGIISINVTGDVAKQTGVYYYELTYEVADFRLETNRRSCAVDVTAFHIVGRTSQADQVYRIATSTTIDPVIDYDEIANMEIFKSFLSKVRPDTAQEKITFLKGIVSMDTSEFVDLISSGLITGVNIDVSNTLKADILRIMTQGVLMGQLNSEVFKSGFLGEGFRLKKINDRWTLEIDDLVVRKTMQVYELIVQKTRYQGGQVLHSPAGGKITAVTNGGTYWRCEHDSTDSFTTGAQVLCQNFKVGSEQQNPDGSTTMNNVSIKRYWRLVTSFGKGWFNLSKSDMEAGSGEPEVGDEVAVLGHRTDPSQQAAIMIVSAGMGSPYTAYYAEIDSYSTEGKEVVREGNLEGIVDEKFGQLQGFGLYSNNVYLRGIFRLMNGKTIEEEILATFSEYEVDFSVLEESIVGKVSRTDYDANNTAIGTELSRIEQKADTIDLSVKRIKVGGKNLLRNFDLRIPEMKYWSSEAQEVTESGSPVTQLTIDGIETIPSVTVQKGGTPYLPPIITLILSDGTTRQVSVSWSSYSTTIIGAFTLDGVYNLPYGVTGSKPTARLTLIVTGTVYSLIGIVQPQAVTIQQGDIAPLPESITLQTSDGGTRVVPVAWGSYDSNAVGVYNLNGVYELPEGVVGNVNEFPATLQLTITAITDAIWNGMPYINALPNLSVPNMVGWEKASCEYGVTIGILNGKLYSWGSNTFGQLGLGDLTSTNIPIQIGQESGWTDVSTGSNHVIAIKNGELWSWGANNLGQLGLGDNVQRNTPQRVGTDNDWTYISASSAFSFGIRAGMLYSWGVNDYGQLGLIDKVNRNTPVQVGKSSTWTKISSGNHFAIGIDNGNLYSWGFNAYGQLGLGNISDYLIPTRIDTRIWTHVSCGGFYAMGISGNDLYVWGQGKDGLLGNNSNNDVLIPTLLSSGWSSVDCNLYHTLGIQNGNLYGWGKNNNGQLGLGDTSDRTVPTFIKQGSPIVAVGFISSYIIKEGILESAGGRNLGVDNITSSEDFVVVGGVVSGLTQDNSDENIFTDSLTKQWLNLKAYFNLTNNSAQNVRFVVNKQGVITETTIPQGEGMYEIDIDGATAFGVSGTDYNITIEEYAIAGYDLKPNWYIV